MIINTVPDFEAQQQYELLVRATDPSGLFVDQTVVLTVNDLNEPPSYIIVTAFDFDEGCLLVPQWHIFPVTILIFQTPSLSA